MIDPRKSLPPSPAELEDDSPLLLVGNPTSRSGKAAERIEHAREVMRQKGVPHEFRSTLPDGGTVGMVAAAIQDDGFRTVVYLGGDGTFNEVARGICGSGLADMVRLGMLPSGTANDQGKSFGISSSRRSIERNVDIIKAGYTTRLDAGEVTAFAWDGCEIARELFFDSVGWGLSAAILAFRNRELDLVKRMPVWREMYRDQLVYVKAAVQQLAINWVTRDRFSAELVIDGVVHNLEGLSDLIVSNTSLYAGEWVIDPDSRHDDGLFEVATFTGTRDWTSKLIVHHKKNPLTEELLNRIGVSHSPTFRGGAIQIQFFRPNVDQRLYAQLDGDEFPQADNFAVTVLPRKLRIIVPEEYQWI
jgi:diacylglycerol kinase family enzyme